MDRRSALVLALLFGGLFVALFGFLFLAYLAIQSPSGRWSMGRGPAIGVLEVKGVIGEADSALEQLRHYQSESRIKAVLVRIDSPGGAVAPSQEIYSALRQIGEEKPVVCSLGDVAASGGYYIAAGCTRIVANPGTLTGSIGVIAQMPFLGDLAEALRFRMVTIKSGKLKDAGNPFREMGEEERKYFQTLLDAVHQQFVAAVAEGRDLPVEEVMPLADGRVMTGAMALEAKLVDELGSFSDAVKLAASLAGIRGEPRLVYPPESRPFPFEVLLEKGGRALARGIRSELWASGAAAGSPAPALVAPLPERVR